jgi:outer membrane lipoprotein SlyB
MAVVYQSLADGYTDLAWPSSACLRCSLLVEQEESVVAINIDWGSIAGTVAPIAPKLGTILGTAIGGLGGPIGAAIGSGIGGVAGRAIAAKFGVEATPEAVGDAIRNDPKASQKLEELEQERGDALLAEAQVKIEEAKQATEQLRITTADRANARAFAWDPINAQSSTRKFQLAFGGSMVFGFFVILVLFMLRPTTTMNEAFILMLGVLTGVVKDISQFYYGSSASSQQKDTTLRTVALESSAEASRVSARVEAGKVAARKNGR